MPEQPPEVPRRAPQRGHGSPVESAPADGRPVGALADRLRTTDGLSPLLAEAEATWRARAAAAGESVDAARPGWRTFEDAFPTFYEFTNRPR
jgi:hypothetical protein